MHTIFGIFVTPFHSNNVMLIRFSLSVSALTFLIMNFTILVQIVTSAKRLTIAFFPTIESSTRDWYEMHVGTRQWNKLQSCLIVISYGIGSVQRQVP